MFSNRYLLPLLCCFAQASGHDKRDSRYRCLTIVRPVARLLQSSAEFSARMCTVNDSAALARWTASSHPCVLELRDPRSG